MTENDNQKRLSALDQFIKVLCSRKDTRNSPIVIQFLELHKLCPDLLYNIPQLRISQKFDKRFVTHCEFIEKYSIYALCIYDISKKISSLEIYAFNYTGVISDTFLIRDQSKGPRKTSPQQSYVKDAFKTSPTSKYNKKFFASVDKPEQQGQFDYLEPGSPDKLDRKTLLAEESLKSKITTLSFCEELDMIILGLQQGSCLIINLSIERAPLFSSNLAQEEEEQKQQIKIKELKNNPATAMSRFQTPDNPLAFKFFTQSESDTPELFENAKWSSQYEEECKSPGLRPTQQNSSKLYTFTLTSHKLLKVHENKVKDMLVDQTRCLLYTLSGTTISVIDLTKQATSLSKHVNADNMRPYRMVLDEQSQKLFVSCRNGTLVIFDTNIRENLMMEHYIKLTKPKSRNYIRSMGLDTMKNILICQMSCSSILCIQLVTSQIRKSTVIEKVNNYESKGNEAITSLNWLSRMNMYCEGTSRGLIKIRDIAKDGELIIQMPAEFTEGNRIQMIGYCKNKNVLYASCRDGGFRIWKVANEWRNKAVEEDERQVFSQIQEEASPVVLAKESNDFFVVEMECGIKK